MSPAVDNLAQRLEEAWARVGYAEQDFPAIAAEALSRPSDLGLPTLARQVCGGTPLPEQRRMDQGFGQPAITLFRGERFLIEALCWHSGTPAIHQHAFSGAFRVVTGHSVHSRYSFAERERVGPLAFGELRLDGVEILDEHSTVPIPRGRGLIHSAFHLDSPSTTVVARTPQSDEPELTYLLPGVAYNPSDRSPSLHKRLQLLDTLNITGHEIYDACVCDAIDGGNLYDGMAVVMRASSHSIDEPTFLRYAARFLDRHGPGVGPLLPALVEERRRGILTRMRSNITDEEPRFFLACLLSFSRRSELMDVMAKRCGDTASARTRIGQGIGQMLGGDRDRQIVSATAADAMLDDVPPVDFADRVARLWRRELTPSERVKLKVCYESLLRNELLRPLLIGDADSSPAAMTPSEPS